MPKAGSEIKSGVLDWGFKVGDYADGQPIPSPKVHRYVVDAIWDEVGKGGKRLLFARFKVNENGPEKGLGILETFSLEDNLGRINWAKFTSTILSPDMTKADVRDILGKEFLGDTYNDTLDDGRKVARIKENGYSKIDSSGKSNEVVFE